VALLSSGNKNDDRVLSHDMPQPNQPVYIPPFSGVRLVECRDHFQLVPVPDVQEIYGYGKVKAAQAFHPDSPSQEPFWDDLDPETEVWAVMQWFKYADGHQEAGNISFLRPEVPEEEVRKDLDAMARFSALSRKELLDVTQCYEAPQDDFDYIDAVRPNYQDEPDPSKTDEYDVYHARLKVMSELQPKTVELLKIAKATKDTSKRQFAERQAVQSYFAELAHYLTEAEVLAWQRSNPVGTGWMCEFGEVMREPRRTIDPVNHELALNWLRSRYNKQTAKQLSESIFKRVLRLFTPDAIKKRRERLGLTTKRKPGAPEK
jgi:hypothetical protein